MINKKLLKQINKQGVGSFVGTTTHDTLTNRNLDNQHSISSITNLETTLDAKQAKLTAGTNITIVGDTISSSGGGSSGNFVTLDTDQTINGKKLFEKGIYFELISSGKNDTKIVNSSQSIEFYSRGIKALSVNSIEVVFNNQRLLYVKAPQDDTDAANKEYVDDGLALKANQTEVVVNTTNIAKNSNDILTKASLVDGKLDVPNNGGIKTTQNIELLSTSLNKQNIVKIVSSRNGSGYRNWTSLEFIDRNGTTDTKKASLEYRPEGLYSIGCALVPDADDCWTSKKYVDDAIVGIDLSSKADKLVVPVNASTDTSTTINDRVVKVVYKEYTSTGDSAVASTTAGFGYLNVSIIRKKSDNSWGIVYNDEFNEVYVNSSNQIRFNIKTLTGYTDEIKLTIQHN